MKKKKKSFWISIPTFFVTNFQARLNRVLEKAADGDDGRRPTAAAFLYYARKDDC
jgi:hypothetical protein